MSKLVYKKAKLNILWLKFQVWRHKRFWRKRGLLGMIYFITELDKY